LSASSRRRIARRWASSWRHPESATDFTGPEYFQRIARVLEEGKFQLAFFDDRLAMPDMYGGDHAHTVQHGIRCVKMDPLAVLMTMGMVTSRLASAPRDPPRTTNRSIWHGDSRPST